jgi:AraC-like DNA-binding protein
MEMIGQTTQNQITLNAMMTEPRWLPPPVRRAVRFASEQGGNPVSLDDVVVAAGVSKQHFCALASQSFGMGFMKVLQQHQTARAKELFDTTDRSVTDVCFDSSVGFNSLRQFRRAFWRFYGCSPADYRQQTREQRRKSAPTDVCGKFSVLGLAS